jgi:hypothetical protein
MRNSYLAAASPSSRVLEPINITTPVPAGVGPTADFRPKSASEITRPGVVIRSPAP